MRRLCQLFDSGGESQRTFRARHASAAFQILNRDAPAYIAEQAKCDADPVGYLCAAESIATPSPIAQSSEGESAVAARAQEHLQQRGRHYDIIQQAIASYDEWMKDDDYDATRKFRETIDRMRERVSMTGAPDVAQCAWQPIETAPHETDVILGWWYIPPWKDSVPNWETELGWATRGWAINGISTRSAHGSATHWMPLPQVDPPALALPSTESK
jgi:hypothetical protein